MHLSCLPCDSSVSWSFFFLYFNLAVHKIGFVWLEKLFLRVWVRCNFSRFIKYKNLLTNDVMDFWNSLRSRFRCEWTSKFARVAEACIAIKSSWKFTNASNHISVLRWIFCASMHLHCIECYLNWISLSYIRSFDMMISILKIKRYWFLWLFSFDFADRKSHSQEPKYVRSIKLQSVAWQLLENNINSPIDKIEHYH